MRFRIRTRAIIIAEPFPELRDELLARERGVSRRVFHERPQAIEVELLDDELACRLRLVAREGRVEPSGVVAFDKEAQQFGQCRAVPEILIR